MSNKQKKIFRIIIISLALLLIIEIIYFGIRFYNQRQNTTFYTVIGSAIIDNDKNYIGVGYTDFKHSQLNKFDEGYNKATIYKIKNGKTVKEVGLKLGLNSLYNDVIEVKDGYIAVGKIEMNKEQNEEKMSEGLIVKYDKNFKQVWRKNVSILEKTELFKVKLDKNDDIVVVGSSVYSEGYIGNHTTGGGILLKYDQNGKKKLKVNNGGPYSGSFNDLLIEDDSYVVVGLGRSNSGIIIKYDKKGKKIWHSSYGYTDKNGINAIAKSNNKYITATTKVINPKELDDYSGAIVIFDKNGNKIDSVKYNDDRITFFKDLKVKDNNIYVCGYTGKNEDNKLKTDAIIVKYDKNLYEEGTQKLKGNNNDVYNALYFKNNNLYALGYTNSKFKEYKTNGYDYYPVLKKYNENLK